MGTILSDKELECDDWVSGMIVAFMAPILIPTALMMLGLERIRIFFDR